MNVPQLMRYVFGWDRNIVGKGENAGNQHYFFFSFSHNVFNSCLFFFSDVKTWNSMVKDCSLSLYLTVQTFNDL